MLCFNSQFSGERDTPFHPEHSGWKGIAVGTFATFDDTKVRAFLVSFKNKITPSSKNTHSELNF
jgi:hypothetical protein